MVDDTAHFELVSGSPSNYLAPTFLNVYIGLQVGSFFWLIVHFAGASLAAICIKKNRLADDTANQKLRESVAYAISAVTSTLNILVTYFTVFTQFLVTNFSWVFLAGFATLLSFLVINYQPGLIVFIDDFYNNIYTPLISPVRFFFNLVVIIFEIVVGGINFFANFTGAALQHTIKIFVTCPGYAGFKHGFFDIFSELGYAVGSLAVSLADWLNGSMAVPFDLTGFVSHLRLIIYDFTLRVQCSCPAERGIVAVIQTGLFDDTTNVLDVFVSEGVNIPLSVMQIILVTVINSASSNTYFAPNTDIVIDHVQLFLNASEKIANQVFFNGMGMIENLLTQAVEGTGTVPWTPIPIFSIPGRALAVTVEALRIFSRCFVNAPTLITFGNRRKAYIWLDESKLGDAMRDFTAATWEHNFGRINRNYLLAFGRTIRDSQNIAIAYFQFIWEVAIRSTLGQDPNQTYSFYGPRICSLPKLAGDQSGYANFWSAAFDLLGRFDTLVVTAIESFGNNINSAIAPYYAPVGEIAAFGTAYIAESQSAKLHQVVYIVYSVVAWSPPSSQCYNLLGRKARVSFDQIIKALPDFFEFFLDVRKAQDMQTAHLLCKEYNVHNFIYSGSLSGYYFASKMCNTRYVDGTLTSCDFYNLADCPDYALAYADLNPQMLCALDIWALEVLQDEIRTIRIAQDYSDRNIVQFIACVIDPTNGTTCPSTASTKIKDLVQQVSQIACDTNNINVKFANVISAATSFVFKFAYAEYRGKPNMVEAGVGNVENYNALVSSDANIVTYVQYKHGEKGNYGCPNFSSEMACVRTDNGHNGHHCYWDGTKCIVNSGSQLRYQKFPLEAALSTFIMSVNRDFWKYYMLAVSADRFAEVLTVDSTLPKTQAYAKVLDKFNTMVQQDTYFVVVDGLRITTLYTRDSIYGMLEFIRTFIFVFNNNGNPAAPFPAAYIEFEETMLKITDLCVKIIQLFIRDGFKILLDITKIIVDFTGLITDPRKAREYIADIGKSFRDMLGTGESTFAEFGNMLLTLPGFENICRFLFDVIDSVTKFVHDGVNFAISFINKIVDGVNIVSKGLFDAIRIFLDLINSFLTDVKRNAAQLWDKTVGPFLTMFNNVCRADLPFTSETLDSIVGCYIESTGAPGILTNNKTAINVKLSDTTIQSVENVNIFFKPPNCTAAAAPETIPNRATTCYFDSTCANSSSYCVINHQNECKDPAWLNTSEFVGNMNFNDLWAKPCRCNSLTSNQYFCNYATNLCNQGITPFADPIMTCPAERERKFVQSSPYYNAICWIVPAYKCKSSIPSSGAHTNRTFTECLNNLFGNRTLMGPHLCRDYCSSDPFNVDNRMYPHPVFGCTCAVGWNVGWYGLFPAYVPSGAFSTTVRHRQLLGLGNTSTYDDVFSMLPDEIALLNAYETKYQTMKATYFQYGDWTKTAWTHHFEALPSTADGVTACYDDHECRHHAALCYGPTPYEKVGILGCTSCPMRSVFDYNSTGHACARNRCTCDEPDPTPLVDPDYTQIVWYGNSKCALLGKAHQNNTHLGVLEYVELRECAKRHYAGLLLGRLTNTPTLSPAIFYDNQVALRTASQLAAGVLVSVLFKNTTNDEIWKILNFFHVDPALAMPFTRHVERGINFTFDSFPRSVNLTKSLTRFSMSAADLLMSTPHPTAVWNSSMFLFETGYTIFEKSGVFSTNSTFVQKATEQFKNASADIVERYGEISDAVRQVVANDTFSVYDQTHRRKLQEIVKIPALTCPVVTFFVSDLVAAANIAITHYTNNIPRAVCRLTAANVSKCPKASWQLPRAQAPPPPSPPPVRAYPPPPMGSAIFAPTKLKGGLIQKSVFSFLKLVTRVDVESFLSGFMNQAFNSLPTRSVISQESNQASSKLKCDFDGSVMCLKKPPDSDLLFSLVYTAALMGIAVGSLSFVGIGFLATPGTVLCLFLFFPTVLNHAYNLPYGCSLSHTPTLPVCLGEDVQSLLLRLLPRYLPWPAPLVNTHNRVTKLQPSLTGRPISVSYLNIDDVFDCSLLGFDDGTRVIIYGLDYLWPAWHKYFSTLTVSTFFGVDANKYINYFKDAKIHGELYKQCAALNSISVVPLVLFALVLLVFAFAALHCVFIFTRNILLSLKSLYLGLALVYISVRDNP